ncbi:cell division control protein 2 homolog B-like isoform X2 [Populus nigra]|uniref:cell division control protein 2 homolog B-like isoform X2 n=1 Tax=Populus nigra TaxID=3691 RepID=UPI002B269E69|nr:cell division control protein 2 homolog B-like isoform X2 [Populus nigra]
MDQPRYQHCRWIGAGAFGKVYQAIDTKINCVVALKLTELEGDGNDGGVPAVSLREMSVLKEMDHENIIKLLDVVHQDGKRLTLVFEFMDGDLLEFMKAHPDRFSDSNLIKRLLGQILSAVDHCHSRRVFHRDLKPANLLVNQKNYTLKVADFGLAKAFSIPQKKCTPQCITLAYRAPEVLLGSTEHYVAADMWSVGCIFAEMVNQERLFDTVNLKRDPDRDFKKEQLSLIFSILGTPEQDSFIGITFPDCLSNFPEHQPPELRVVVPTLGSTGIDLLSKMLCLDPERRITAAAALRHEYFRDIAGQ